MVLTFGFDISLDKREMINAIHEAIFEAKSSIFDQQTYHLFWLLHPYGYERQRQTPKFKS